MHLPHWTKWLCLSLLLFCAGGTISAADSGPEPPGALVVHDFKARMATLAWGGKQLLLGGQDGGIRLWNPDTGKVETLKEHKKAVRALAVSRDGKLLASAGDDTQILIWDLGTRKILARIEGPKASVRGLTFSPNAKVLAWVAGDHQIHRARVPTGKALPAFRAGDTNLRLMSVCFSPDGTQLLAGGHTRYQDRVGGCSFHLFDLATGKNVWGAHNNRSRDEASKETADHLAPLAFSRDGKTWGGLAADDTIFTRREGHFYHSAGRRLTALAFTDDSHTLIVAGRDGAVRFVQETKPKIAKQEGATVYLAEVAKVKEVAVLNRQGEVVGLALSPDGKRLAWVTDQGKVRVGSVSKVQTDNAVVEKKQR
jgi:WD40 repeat protein